MPKKNGSEKDVWVLLEHGENVLSVLSLELLGKGREIADKLQERLVGVLIGNDLSKIAQDASEYGADEILVLDDQALKEEVPEVYASLLKDMILERNLRIILGSCNEFTRQVFARLQVYVDTGLGSDCIDIGFDEDNKNLIMRRSIYGGNVECNGIIEHNYPQMATVRPRVLQMAAKLDKSAVITNIPVKNELCNKNIEILEIKEEGSQIKLTEAEVIVSGGRGMGGDESFPLLEELANVVGGALGASRSAVDANWIPYKHQVGQTGQIVQPRIYIACGISGAIQHLVGMQTSDVIIAVNKDPDCTMMKMANYALEGDLFKIIPILKEELKKVLA